ANAPRAPENKRDLGDECRFVMHIFSPFLTNKSKIVQANTCSTAARLPMLQACDRKGGRVAQRLKRSSGFCRDLQSEHGCFHEAGGELDIDARPDFVCRLRVSQPLDQRLVLRATAPGTQCYQAGVGVSEFA